MTAEANYLRDRNIFDRTAHLLGRETLIDVRTWKEDSLVPTALALAAQVFDPKLRVCCDDGSILVPLGEGRSVALACQAEIYPDAFALPRRAGATYFVVVTAGLLRALFNIAAAVWSDPGFLTSLGAQRPAPERTEGSLPRGLEQAMWVAWSRNQLNAARPSGSRFSQAEEASWDRLREIFSTASFAIQPSLLADRLASLEGIRKKCFEATFLSSIRFVWLHEVAHVVHGHVDLLHGHSPRLGLSEVEFAGSFLNLASGATERKTDAPPLPFHAMEMEADDEALGRVNAPASKAHLNSHASVSALGCLMPILIFHALNTLTGQSDRAEKHPPLWFRAARILERVDEGRDRGMMMMILRDLGKMDPLYGDWLEPVVFTPWEAAMERVRQRALDEREPWIPALEAHARSGTSIFRSARDR
jgi:hypothetical protein